MGKVSATVRFICPKTDPEAVTRTLGIQPTYTNISQGTAAFTATGLKEPMDCGIWCYDTAAKVSSSDPNTHLRHLLALFLPLRSRLEELRPPPGVVVEVYWESTVAGIAGPTIDKASIRGLAELGASLDIRVVKIDRVEGVEG